MKAGGIVLCLCDFFIKFFNIIFCLSNQVFIYLVIIWTIYLNFSFCAYKNFCFYEILSIYSNVALIIACRYVFSWSKITCIIWTCPAKKRLLNYLLIVQVCSRNLTISTIDIKLYSLRYKINNSFRLSIRFMVLRYKYLLLLFRAFTINSNIIATMVLSIITIFARV